VVEGAGVAERAGAVEGAGAARGAGMDGPDLCGLVLAAGAGTRFGGPKALAHGPDGPWLAEAVRVLRDGGCGRVVVVLGAAAERARPLVPEDPHVHVVLAERWDRGAGESLRTGLAHASGDAVVVMLVDLPGTPVSVVRRVLAGGVDAGTLRRAVYAGRPGHPVVLGRDHWRPLSADLAADLPADLAAADSTTGGPGSVPPPASRAAADHGARHYLRSHGVERVECSDLHHGRDVDT